MAYTNTWSNIIPAGSAAANTVDDQIRQLRLDIQERMDDIVIDWTADPVVLDVGVIGAQTGVVRFFGPWLIAPARDDDDVSWGNFYFEADNNANFPAFMPLALPVGAVVTEITIISDKNTATNYDATFNHSAYATSPVFTEVSSVTVSATGVREDTVFTGTHTVATLRVYMLKFNSTGGGRFRIYGAKVTFNVSGLSAYL